MPLSSEIVGRVGEPIVQQIDARWTMAHAAGLGDLDAAYLDTRRRPDVLAHPLSLDPRCMPTDLPPNERVRGVHFTHDLTLRMGPVEEDRVRFEVLEPGGGLAIREGLVELRA